LDGQKPPKKTQKTNLPRAALGPNRTNRSKKFKNRGLIGLLAAASESKTRTQRRKKRGEAVIGTATFKNADELRDFNARRREKRNSWTKIPCVKRPDSKKAGEKRQLLRKNGMKGQGTYVPRPWC
jgi:hypothetical protein